MKKLHFFLVKSILLLALVTFSSCGGDDDDNNDSSEGSTSVTLPSDLVDSYTGVLTYTVNQVPSVTNLEGTATITSTGDNTYRISFSDDVPTITGLRFIESDGTYASASTGDSTVGVSFDDDDLSVGVTSGSEQWAFSSN